MLIVIIEGQRKTFPSFRIPTSSLLVFSLVESQNRSNKKLCLAFPIFQVPLKSFGLSANNLKIVKEIDSNILKNNGLFE